MALPRTPPNHPPSPRTTPALSRRSGEQRCRGHWPPGIDLAFEREWFASVRSYLLTGAGCWPSPSSPSSGLQTPQAQSANPSGTAETVPGLARAIRSAWGRWSRYPPRGEGQPSGRHLPCNHHERSLSPLIPFDSPSPLQPPDCPSCAYQLSPCFLSAQTSPCAMMCQFFPLPE
jgi:hypothetical protein